MKNYYGIFLSKVSLLSMGSRELEMVEGGERRVRLRKGGEAYGRLGIRLLKDNPLQVFKQRGLFNKQ